MENNTLCNRHSLGVNNHTKMYVTYTRIYGWSDYGGESSYQPGYRLENMMWMTLLVYDYIIPGEKVSILSGVTIGEKCIIGAGSIVTKSIPSYSIAVGNPARIIKQYNFYTKRWERYYGEDEKR